MLLNFSDRTRTGVFSMIWPLANPEGKTWRLILILSRFVNSIKNTFFEYTYFVKKLVHPNVNQGIGVFIFLSNALLSRYFSDFE